MVRIPSVVPPLLLLLAVSCGETAPAADGGLADGGVTDAGVADGSAVDGSAVDAGAVDASTPDAAAACCTNTECAAVGKLCSLSTCQCYPASCSAEGEQCAVYEAQPAEFVCVEDSATDTGICRAQCTTSGGDSCPDGYICLTNAGMTVGYCEPTG